MSCADRKPATPDRLPFFAPHVPSSILHFLAWNLDHFLSACTNPSGSRFFKRNVESNAALRWLFLRPYSEVISPELWVLFSGQSSVHFTNDLPSRFGVTTLNYLSVYEPVQPCGISPLLRSDIEWGGNDASHTIHP